MRSATPTSTTPVVTLGFRAWSLPVFTFLLDNRRDGETANSPQGSIWCNICRCYWLLTEPPLFSQLKGAVAGWISMLIDSNGFTKKRGEHCSSSSAVSCINLIL